jgi:hypothetical protein
MKRVDYLVQTEAQSAHGNKHMRTCFSRRLSLRLLNSLMALQLPHHCLRRWFFVHEQLGGLGDVYSLASGTLLPSAADAEAYPLSTAGDDYSSNPVNRIVRFSK